MANHLIYSDTPKEAEGYVTARVSRESGRAILLVMPSDREMELVAAQMEVYTPGAEVLCFPAWDTLPYDRSSPKQGVMAERLSVLAKLTSSSSGLTRGSQEKSSEMARDPRIKPEDDGNKKPEGNGNRGKFGKRLILITTVNAITQKLPPRSVMEHATLTLATGGELNRDALMRYLVANGYQRVSKAMEAGEFAMRGNIIDLFPSGYEKGCRIDCFGDEIESIHSFDPLSQRSEKEVIPQITLHPVSEVLLDEASITRFREGYRDAFGAVSKPDALYTAIREGKSYHGMENWLPLFYSKLNTLYDYLPEDCLTLFSYSSQAVQQDRAALVQDYYMARSDLPKGIERDYQPLPPERLYLLEEDWEKLTAERDTIQLTPFSDAKGVSQQIKQGREFSGERRDGKNPFEAAVNYLQMLERQGTRVKIAAISEGSAQNLAEKLSLPPVRGEVRRGGDASYSEQASLPHSPTLPRTEGGSIKVLPLPRGFIAADEAWLSEQDILGERRMQKRTKRRSTEEFFAEAANFSEGELVVHKEHGIGRFEGLVTMEAAGVSHDCLKLVYAENARLFLPVENIDLISRYGDVGEEEAETLLDKLGGTNWQARKARLKERIKIAAEELMKIAAKRNLAKAPILSPPEGLYEEFCNRFPYVETDDQARAIEDILEDFQKGLPADRLICGDVGFGKTEVALRAAFVAAAAAEGGVQVALIAPTTLLVRQHYQTFKERFKDLPVEIRQLSRLVSSKESKETTEALEKGKIDIIIGTHALLSERVKFDNLGLLIVDEEQHFGVKQKEKLKKLRSNIHVMTLSATPIPRTLQLSLTGVRDLSLITTAPVDRLAVRTFVSPYDPVMIREALLREYHRGGQSFYVTPYVKDMAELERRITELVPEMRIVTANGQMAAGELDSRMNDFYEGKYDILMSTTIIESGIDIPTANTLIINRADRFGLSQLYQLRGRVGRSKTRAYAYLTLPHHQHFTANAMRRLEVMQTLDTLGAGFTVASHDMDIRGFGNLVGEEQSGHIKEVGAELYQHMLEEAVRKVKAQNAAEKEAQEELAESEDWRPQIRLGLSVLLPEDYITDLDLRLGLYRRAGTLKDDAAIEEFGLELADRFGPVPKVAQYFLETLKLKLLCAQANIARLDSGPKGVVLSFHNNEVKNPQALLQFIAKHKTQMKIRPDQKLVISYDAAQKDTARRVEGLKKIISTIAQFSNAQEIAA
jgi:transcription-repair coupling factor (superfamily II helicase)